jgi:hypothetical protein
MTAGISQDDGRYRSEWQKINIDFFCKKGIFL